MAYPPGMEMHGSTWRIKKRIPTQLLKHYEPSKFLHFTTGATDKKAAAVLAWEWHAATVAEFERIRKTGSRYKQAISPEDIAHLVRLMVRSMMAADEESREAGDYADDERYAAALQYLDAADEETRQALSRRIFSGDLPMIVEDWLQGHGYDIPRDSDSFRLLCVEFAKGRAEAIRMRRARNAGEWIDTPSAAPLVRPVPSQGTPLLSAVVSDFLSKQNQEAPMFKKHRVATDLLLEVLGDRPVAPLTQMEIDDFFELLCKLPPRWKDQKRKLGAGVVELAKMEWPCTINKKTFDDSYMAALRRFFVHAHRRFGEQGFPRHLITEGIKYTGSFQGGEKKQRGLRLDELKRLFEGPEYVAFATDPAHAHCYWLPLLGLFTGARVNEVCQLNPQCDIREDAGVWFFDITEDSDTDARVKKSVKNAPSRRRVPLHSALVTRGLLDYVHAMKAAGHALLFPQWPPTRGKASGKAEKWFRSFVEQLGLRDETEGARVVGFHALRSTFLSRCDHLDIPKPGTLTGHRQGEDNRDEAGYKDPIALGKNRDKMERVFYELTIPVPRSIDSQ